MKLGTDNMGSFWSKSIFLLTSRKEKWIFIGFISVFITLFLLIFQPFGVNNFDSKNSIDLVFLFSMIGFGFVIAIVLALFEFIIAPSFFKKNTLIVFVIRIFTELVIVAAAVFFYYNLLGNFHDWYFKSFIDFIFNISVTAIIPIAIVLLYSSNREVRLAFETLELKSKTDMKDAFATLKSYNEKEQLIIKLIDLLYIEAQDNYVLVYYLENELIKKSLLRAKMKELQSVLNSKRIVRCHRSYLINIKNVNRVIKSSGQMKLNLKYGSEEIPVSKSYFSVIQDFFDVHHK